MFIEILRYGCWKLGKEKAAEVGNQIIVLKLDLLVIMV